MQRSIFGASVQGASHKRNDLPCQDSYTVRDNTFKYDYESESNVYYSGLDDDIGIVSVADGHGSAMCPYSQYGSSIAVDVFCDIMAESCYRFHDNMEDLIIQLNKESECIRISQSIEREWKLRVQEDYSNNKGERDTVLSEEDEDEYSICRLYGTTLLGMLITDQFVFSFQLGDGDINYVSDNDVHLVLEQEKILGVETHSLSKKSAWQHALYSFNKMEDYTEIPFMFMLSTDGMVNSYISEEEFNKSCKDYLSLLKEHGVDPVKDNLPKWLDETSEQGCGDDTTVVMVYVYW